MASHPATEEASKQAVDAGWVGGSWRGGGMLMPAFLRFSFPVPALFFFALFPSFSHFIAFAGTLLPRAFGFGYSDGEATWDSGTGRGPRISCCTIASSFSRERIALPHHAKESFFFERTGRSVQK